MRFSGHFRINIFSNAPKANGRAAIRRSPVSIFVTFSRKTSRHTTNANLKTKRIAIETRVGQLKNSSRLSTCLRRLQQLPLQENLRQLIKSVPIPPVHRSQGQLQQPRRLLESKLLQSNPPDQMLHPVIERLNAALHVVHEDHHIVEALHGVVRHIPTKHLPSQQR